jgi:hypothetical protein
VGTIAGRARKAACVTLDIGKNPVVARLVQAAELVLEERFKIHGILPMCHFQDARQCQFRQPGNRIFDGSHMVA